jgi:hypothetical protein
VIPSQEQRGAILTQRQAEQRLGLRPGLLANAFHRGDLTDDFCLYYGCKRAIDEDALPLIREALRRAGRLPKPAAKRD